MRDLYNFFFYKNYRIKEINSTYPTGWIYVTNPITELEARLWLWSNHCKARENAGPSLNICSELIWWQAENIYANL